MFSQEKSASTVNTHSNTVTSASAIIFNHWFPHGGHVLQDILMHTANTHSNPIGFHQYLTVEGFSQSFFNEYHSKCPSADRDIPPDLCKFNTMLNLNIKITTTNMLVTYDNPHAFCSCDVNKIKNSRPCTKDKRIHRLIKFISCLFK